MGLRARHEFPSAKIVRGTCHRANTLRRQQMRFDRCRDTASDVS